MSTTHPPASEEIPAPTIEEVSEGIFANVQLDGSWGLNNAGFFVGKDAVTVVDTCFTEARTRAFVDAIASVTALPMRTLVNTHTHGNYLLPGATIIAHELCREVILEGGPSSTTGSGLFPNVQWGNLEIAPPFVTFQERLSLYVDDLKVEALYVGPAHTSNDVVLWVPERKLLFSGDILFNGGTPFVIAGSVAGSLKALDTLRALGAEIIVPGHGPVCGAEVIDDMAAYLRFVQELARRSFEAGLSPLESAREAELGRFAGWHDAERLAGNLHRASSAIKGEPLGTTLDPRPMIADNGCKPVRCLA